MQIRMMKSLGLICRMSLCLILFISISACGVQLREDVLKLIDEHVKDIQAIGTAGGKLQPVVSDEMKFIKAAMGNDLEKIPMEQIKLMDSMTTEKDPYKIAGMYGRFWVKGTIIVIEEFAPQVFAWIGKVFK